MLGDTCVVKWNTALAVTTSGEDSVLETQNVCIYESLKNYCPVLFHEIE
jgi:hypothetical protein